MGGIAIVIPHHLRDLKFLESWKHEFNRTNVKVIVVVDHDHKLEKPDWGDIDLYYRKDIQKELGDKAWIIPSKTSACRSFGYYKAWQSGSLLTITLDNDCYPEQPKPYWIEGHVKSINSNATLGWWNTESFYTRGFPYGIRGKSAVVINHGLWSNVPDLDGASMLIYPDLRSKPATTSTVIPQYNYYTMCGMNLAFRTSITPIMYFGLFGPDYGFDQYDDIWAGVVSKKICDHLGLAVRSGYPSVEHRKQSNAFTNVSKQAPGLKMNEHLYKVVDKIKLKSTDPLLAYKELINKLPDEILDEPTGYTKKWKQAAIIWADLFV